MPNVAEGLAQAPPEENVNSDAGFEAALARKAGTTDVLAERDAPTSTTVADGLTTGPAQPFSPAPADTEEDEEDTPAGTTEEENSFHEDPNLNALLEKHDGDPVAALAELNERFANAQSLIGRQGHDMGQLRTELAELRGMVQAQRELVTAPQQQPQVFDADDIAELVANQTGQGAALWAVQNGDDRLVEAVIREWSRQAELEGEGTFEPLAFRQDWIAFKNQQAAAAAEQARTKEPPKDDPALAWARQQAGVQQYSSVLDKVEAESPDWDTFSPHMMSALEQSTPRVLAMVNSSDPEEQYEGTKIVAQTARLIALQNGAATTVANAAGSEAAEARKNAARVATGSLRPASTQRQSVEEMTSEERIALFKKNLMEQTSTSVQDGLTYGSR